MRRFEALTTGLLAKYGVTVVAMSRDTVSQAAAHRQRDALTLTLLSDPELAVIKSLGLLHRKGISFATVDVFGVPMGVPKGFQDMAIPTSLIVDESGVVRWIDQADDYRIRGDTARIEAALAKAFPHTGA